MHIDMYPLSTLTPEQSRQMETYEMFSVWLAEPYPREMRSMLTGDLVQEYEGLQETLRSLFESDLIEEEVAGKLALALAKQMRDIEAELHRRIFVARTAPAGLRPLLPRDLVQAVKARTDIVRVFEACGVSLRKAGRCWKGLCPFHDDHQPSLALYPQTQSFYCFGCHRGGDAIEAVKLLDKVSFTEAVRRLGKECGVEVPPWPYAQRARDIAARYCEINP